MELTTITSATATSILLDRVTGSRGIALVGDQIKIRQGAALPDAATGDILVDHVAGFTLTYFKGDQPWQVGTDDVRLLTRIQVDVILSRPESGGSDVSFTTTVNPRNNRSYGGSGPRWEF
jgi:hypothetical protein